MAAAPLAELMPAVAPPHRALLGDLENKLVAKVTGVHAKISGLRLAHDAPLAELMPAGAPPHRALLGDLENKLVAKVSGVHAKISGLRLAHDAPLPELMHDMATAWAPTAMP